MTNERINELEAALGRIHRDKWSNNEQIIAECLEEIKRLRKLLVRLGDHAGNCEWWLCRRHLNCRKDPTHNTNTLIGCPCTCGLEEVLRDE